MEGEEEQDLKPNIWQELVQYGIYNVSPGSHPIVY